MKRCLTIILTLVAGLSLTAFAEESPLPVEEIKRDKPVDFSSKILPVLKRNCLACHNETKAKASLILETPATMLKGGDEGPAVIPGNPADSLLFITAAHLDDPVMPPPDNKSKAVNLTALELGLLRQWISEGATGEIRSYSPAPEKWLRDPENRTIYAIAVSPDDRFAAFGRGHSIEIFDLKKNQSLGTLADPELDFGSHRDVVHSLAFSADGTLASGGFREIKLWKRGGGLPAKFEGEFPAATPDPALKIEGPKAVIQVGDKAVTLTEGAALARVALSPDRKHALTAAAKGSVSLWEVATAKKIASLDLAPVKQGILDRIKQEEAIRNRLISTFTVEVTAREDAQKKEEEFGTELADALPALELGLDEARQLSARNVEAAKIKEALGETVEAPAEDPVSVALLNLDTGRRKLAGAVKMIGEAAAKVAEAKMHLATATKARDELKAKGDALTAEIQKERADLAIAGIAFSPDGSEAIIASRPGAIHRYATATGIYLESSETGLELEAMAISGNALITKTTKEGKLHSWPLPGKFEPGIRIGDGKDGDVLVDRVTALAFHPFENVLVSGSGIPTRSGDLKTWNPVGGSMIAEHPRAHRDSITSIRFSHDGERFVSGSADKFAKVFSTGELELKLSLEGHTGHVLGVDWSRDGRTIVTAGSDHESRLWDVAIGEVRQTLKRGDSEVMAVRFANPANDSLIAVYEDQSIKLDATAFPENGEFYALEMTRDGKKTIAGGETGRLVIWDTASRKVERILETK